MKKNTLLIAIIILLILNLSYGLYYVYKNTSFFNMHNNMMGINSFNLENNIEKNTDKNTNEMMKNHCKMMPEMLGCEKYFEVKNISNEELIYGKGQIAENEKPQEIINLKNGDAFTMEITKIKKNIGGKEIEMLAYNGSIPGPIIKAKVGSKIKLTLVNKVLDLETTLHSHGLRLSDIFDGVTKDMMGKQDPIKNDDTFTYEISFPDVGVFWYHPHMREDIQQEMGLYGTYIVEPNEDNYYSKVNNELSIMLDDIALEGGKLEPFYKNYTDHVLMGRYGNTSFVNGNPDYMLNMKKGEIVRLYLTDVANTRVFNFKIPGLKMKLVGSDIGKYEKETFIDSLIISPGERYIVDIYALGSGTFDIQNSTPEKDNIIGKVVVSDSIEDVSFVDDFNKLRINSDISQDIENYKKYFDKKIGKNISFELANKGTKGGMGGMIGMGNMMGDNHDGIEWEDNMEMMNKNSNSNTMEWKIIDKETQNENMAINWQFKKGDVIKIQIENKKDSMHPMQHPFHMHGQRFLVLSRDGVKQKNLVWKDTVLVKTGEIVEILVDMSNSGEWMAHCHIAEHLFSGMMMHFSVKE